MDEKQLKVFLSLCQKGRVTVKDIARLGYRWMRKAKLYHHFFGNYTLWETALHLALFSLKLPYEYKDPALLNRPVNAEEAVAIFALFEKRIYKKIPIPYLTNEMAYLGRWFYVNESVLVPRSLMNNRFQEFLSKIDWHNYRVLDLCTGSGCIGITLALLEPRVQVDLADISEKALEVAQVNIQRYGLEGRVRCIQSDLFKNIDKQYDLIISNPPYVSESEYERQPDEIKNEPKIALTAGKTGLDIIEQILSHAKAYLNPHGTLIVEVGYPAAKQLKKKYRNIPFEWSYFRETDGNQSWFDALIGWLGYPHGVFLCSARGLPGRV